MKLPGAPTSPLSWLGDELTQCASHVRQSPLCVLPIGCPQAWFIIQESRCPSPPNNDGSVAVSSECKETGPALVGRPIPSHSLSGRCLTLRRAPHGCLAHLYHGPRRPTLEPDDGRRVRSDAGGHKVPRSCDGPRFVPLWLKRYSRLSVCTGGQMEQSHMCCHNSVQLSIFADITQRYSPDRRSNIHLSLTTEMPVRS